jgi:hypothetical protein
LKAVLSVEEFEVIAHMAEFDGYDKMTLMEIESTHGDLKNVKKLRSSALEKIKKCKDLEELYEEID